MRASPRESVPIVVIGAGQAGLSAAYWLRRLGARPRRDVVVVDADPLPGGAWQHRWEALRLDDAHRVADLPGMHELGLSFDTAPGDRPARDIVVDYYGRYERHFDLRVQHGTRVESVRYTVERSGEGPARGVSKRVDTSAGAGFRGPAGDARFLVERPDLAIAASVIVNATGTWNSPFVPYMPGIDRFRGPQITTRDYRSAQQFAGMRVAVVGGGTSATGFLLELDGVAAQARWYTRRPVRFIDQDHLTTAAGIASVAAEDAAARAGLPLPSIVSTTGMPITRRLRPLYERGGLQPRPMFRQIAEDAVIEPDGTSTPTDAIIWATGFRPHLRHLAPLGLREPTGGYRVEDGQLVREPHIFLAGYGPQASTITANRAGRVTARRAMALAGLVAQ